MRDKGAFLYKLVCSILGKRLFFQYKIFEVDYLGVISAALGYEFCDFVASVHDRRVIPASDSLTYRNEGEREEFRHKVNAYLTWFGYFAVLLFADKVFFGNVIIVANRGYDNRRG